MILSARVAAAFNAPVSNLETVGPLKELLPLIKGAKMWALRVANGGTKYISLYTGGDKPSFIKHIWFSKNLMAIDAQQEFTEPEEALDATVYAAPDKKRENDMVFYLGVAGGEAPTDLTEIDFASTAFGEDVKEIPNEKKAKAPRSLVK